jgi:hypothetical protein
MSTGTDPHIESSVELGSQPDGGPPPSSPPDGGQETPSHAVPGRRQRFASAVARRAGRVRDGANLVQLLAIVPTLSMTLLVLGATKLQWFDYWSILPRVVNPDGSFAPRDLLHYHEGHILAVPSVVYWLNYKLTSGLNTSLGLFVIGLVLAQVWMLRRLLPRAELIGRWVYAAVFVAGVSLLFAPQGVHNFARAMSGSAWLLANFFAVAALLIASRGPLGWGLLLASPFALLASLSYGTGLMVWPALLVLTVLRHRWGWRQLGVAVAGAVVVGTYFLFYERPASQSTPTTFDPNDMARRSVQVLGSVLTPSANGAVAVGILALVLAGFAVVRAVTRDRVVAAPWVALVTYAVLGAAMIGAARGGVNSDDIGTASRYYSLAALCWTSVLVLLALAWPRDPRSLLAALAIGGLAFVGGQPAVDYVRDWDHRQDELAIAMRLGVSQDYPFFWGYDRYRPWLEELGHYPFSADYDADCGRTGRSVEPEATVNELDGARGSNDGFITPYNDASVRFEGWVGIPGESVKCVLVADEDLTVVGAGVYGLSRPDLVTAGGSPISTYDVGFVAVALAGEDEYQLVVETHSGRLVRLPDPPGPAATPVASRPVSLPVG